MMQNLEVMAVTEFGQAAEFDPDLIFLDIEMPGKSGIEIKEEMESNKSDSLIIFVTNHSESVMSAFGTNVIGFFEKPLEYEQFVILMTKAKNLSSIKDIVEIDPFNIVKIEDIRYITIDGVYSEVNKAGEGGRAIIARKSLTEWETTLPADKFIRISKSCIVNCGHIESLHGDQIKMDGNGEKLVCSRRRKGECQNKYSEYCKNMARYGR